MTEPADNSADKPADKPLSPTDQPDRSPARGAARHVPPPKPARASPDAEEWHAVLDDPEALGARLHALRLAAGLSAAEVGRAAGRSGPYLRQVERGKRRPSPGTVRLVLGVLLAGVDEQRETVLEDLIRLGTISGALADERPERRKARRQAAARAREQIRRTAAAGTADLTKDELGVMLAPDAGREAEYEALLAKLAEPDPALDAMIAAVSAPDPALDRMIDEARADMDRLIDDLVAEHPPGALVDELLDEWQSARQAEGDRPPDPA